MFDEERAISWDAVDIKMAIKRYFHKLGRKENDGAQLEIDFLRSIHREWSYNPLMRRCGPEAMAIIDDFLRWFDATATQDHSVHDFTVRRLIK